MKIIDRNRRRYAVEVDRVSHLHCLSRSLSRTVKMSTTRREREKERERERERESAHRIAVGRVRTVVVEREREKPAQEREWAESRRSLARFSHSHTHKSMMLSPRSARVSRPPQRVLHHRITQLRIIPPEISAIPSDQFSGAALADLRPRTNRSEF